MSDEQEVRGQTSSLAETLAVADVLAEWVQRGHKTTSVTEREEFRTAVWQAVELLFVWMRILAATLDGMAGMAETVAAQTGLGEARAAAAEAQEEEAK